MHNAVFTQSCQLHIANGCNPDIEHRLFRDVCSAALPSFALVSSTETPFLATNNQKATHFSGLTVGQALSYRIPTAEA
jgi:hypothetical protein